MNSLSESPCISSYAQFFFAFLFFYLILSTLLMRSMCGGPIIPSTGAAQVCLTDVFSALWLAVLPCSCFACAVFLLHCILYFLNTLCSNTNRYSTNGVILSLRFQKCPTLIYVLSSFLFVHIFV